MRRRLWPLAIVTLAVTAARADVGNTVLLPAEAAGPISARELKRVDLSLAEVAVGMRLVNAAERSRAPRKGCAADAACGAEIGRSLGAARVVGATVARSSRDAYAIEILYVDAASATVLSQGKRESSKAKLATTPRKLLASVLWLAPGPAR